MCAWLKPAVTHSSSTVPSNQLRLAKRHGHKAAFFRARSGIVRYFLLILQHRVIDLGQRGAMVASPHSSAMMYTGH